jgi:ribosome-associated toxin RatA of RatAB toxin-antitoxin module
MFDLVADIRRYPEFLPWVVAVRIRQSDEALMVADMSVGFKSLRETFTSRVKLDRPGHIDVDYVSGPLKHLHNDWHFHPTPAAAQTWNLQSISNSDRKLLKDLQALSSTKPSSEWSPASKPAR